MSAEAPLLNTAFNHIRQLQLIYGDAIPAAVIEQGFIFAGEKILLLNRAGGIFKPKQMQQGVISIKTTMLKDGRINIYNYSDRAKDEGYYQYSLQQGDPKGGRNAHLWQALDSRQPFIYFYAIAPAVYTALWPCFIESIHPSLGFAKILVGVTEYSTETSSSPHYHVADKIESRYIVRQTKTRLHQASFRKNVLSVYQNSCAITGLTEPQLIEASHIIPDGSFGPEQLITNGIALNNIHHKAYDRNLLGIDENGKIHISPKLSAHVPNKFLESAFLKYNQQYITTPSNKAYQPDRNGLSNRFDSFMGSY